jgi:hypothetical protein
MEVSYTPWGVNPNTPVLNLKSEDICFLDKCLSEGNYTSNYHDHLFALKAQAEQSLEQSQSAAKEDLVTFYNLLNL